MTDRDTGALSVADELAAKNFFASFGDHPDFAILGKAMLGGVSRNKPRAEFDDSDEGIALAEEMGLRPAQFDLPIEK